MQQGTVMNHSIVIRHNFQPVDEEVEIYCKKGIF